MFFLDAPLSSRFGLRPQSFQGCQSLRFFFFTPARFIFNLAFRLFEGATLGVVCGFSLGSGNLSPPSIEFHLDAA